MQIEAKKRATTTELLAHKFIAKVHTCVCVRACVCSEAGSLNYCLTKLLMHEAA